MSYVQLIQTNQKILATIPYTVVVDYVRIQTILCSNHQLERISASCFSFIISFAARAPISYSLLSMSFSQLFHCIKIVFRSSMVRKRNLCAYVQVHSAFPCVATIGRARPTDKPIDSMEHVSDRMVEHHH